MFMISEIIMSAVALHKVAYNPNTEFLFLEVIMSVSSLVAIGATIMMKLFLLRKTDY